MAMKTEHSKKKKSINKNLKNLEEKQSVKHQTLSTRLLRNEGVLGFWCPLGKGRLGYGDIQKFNGHQSKIRQEKNSGKKVWRFPKANFVHVLILQYTIPGTVFSMEESTLWYTSSLGKNEEVKSSGIKNMF